MFSKIPTNANRYNRVILSLLWYVEQAEYFHPFYIVFMDVFCRGETTNKLIETIALQVRQLKEVPIVSSYVGCRFPTAAPLVLLHIELLLLHTL